MNKIDKNLGFTLIELLITIAVIGLMASIVFLALGSARVKSRDTKRKADLSQLGQILYSGSCYTPNAGAGDYDIADLLPELKTKYPQYAQYSFLMPKDPKTGSGSQTNYRYKVTNDGHCVVYANFENKDEQVTLSGISAATPGIGGGFFRSAAIGPNGTDIYYQIGK
jgi:prepilin-type N-terminal cleavage/methylation domain-containing protein